MLPKRGPLCLALLLASLLAPSMASAQFALDRAQLSGAPDDGIMVHRPFMGEGSTRLYGNLGVGYAQAPLRKDGVTGVPSAQLGMDDPVQGQFLVYPSLGVQFLGRVSFNVHLPFVPYQFTGTDPAGSGIGNGGLTGYNSSLGDLRIDGRVLALRSRSGKTSLGVEGFFTFPTGSVAGFGGDRTGTAEILATFEAHFRSFFLVANLGPNFRPQSGVGGTNGQLRIGNELRFALAGYLPVRDSLRLGLEVWGGTGLENVEGQSTFFSQRNTFIEWLAQARVPFGEEKRLYANFGAGTRLSAGYGAADFRLMASLGYALPLEKKEELAPARRKQIESRPEHYEPDSDGDGYPDGIDACPDRAEDGAPPKKTDGCPAG